MLKILAIISALAIGACAIPLQAQHPIDVERSAAQADYMRAMVAFDKLPQRRVTAGARLAAAKSAWALGLSSRAIKEYDQVLREGDLSAAERVRALISRGIIEYQEDRYQVAILFAERAVQACEAGPLRAGAWALWGASLARLNSFGLAEEKYLNALEEAASADKPNYHYLLGVNQVYLNKLKDAQANFESVPLTHERAPAAMRALAKVAFDLRDIQEARFWLERGREDYPESFLDSWVDYKLAQCAIAEDDGKRLSEILEHSQKRYPPSDTWMTLMQAAAEVYHWEARRALAAAKTGGREQAR